MTSNKTPEYQRFFVYPNSPIYSLIEWCAAETKFARQAIRQFCADQKAKDPAIHPVDAIFLGLVFDGKPAPGWKNIGPYSVPNTDELRLKAQSLPAGITSKEFSYRLGRLLGTKCTFRKRGERTVYAWFDCREALPILGVPVGANVSLGASCVPIDESRDALTLSFRTA